MRDFMDLGGTTPPEEDCAQVGSRDYDYPARARSEAAAHIAQLRRVFGPEPDGAALGVKSHPHDFGHYLTVVCYYDPEIAVAANYARRCEADGPHEWDPVAREQLDPTRKETSHGHLD